MVLWLGFLKKSFYFLGRINNLYFSDTTGNKKVLNDFECLVNKHFKAGHYLDFHTVLYD